MHCKIWYHCELLQIKEIKIQNRVADPKRFEADPGPIVYADADRIGIFLNKHICIGYGEGW